MTDARASEFLTVDETADELHVSGKHIRRQIKCGALPHYRFGKLLRIGRSDLDKYKLSCRNN